VILFRGSSATAGHRLRAEHSRFRNGRDPELRHVFGAGHFVDAAPTAGAVARLGTGVVEISNVWASPREELDWSELVAAVAARFPGRALVGWAHGPALEHAQHAGFSAVGLQHVWVRPA